MLRTDLWWGFGGSWKHRGKNFKNSVSSAEFLTLLVVPDTRMQRRIQTTNPVVLRLHMGINTLFRNLLNSFTIYDITNNVSTSCWCCEKLEELVLGDELPWQRKVYSSDCGILSTIFRTVWGENWRLKHQKDWKLGVLTKIH